MQTYLSALIGTCLILVFNYVHAEDAMLSARVLHCLDGDTCRIKIQDTIWVNVRLAGIDAPEVEKPKRGATGQPLGNEARDFLNATLKDKIVEVRQTDLDPYNRPVVEIFLDKTMVNVTMLEKGYAEAYRGKTKRLNKEIFFAAEEKAKKAKLGIWSLSDYTSPTEFRKQTKGKNQ